MYPTWNQVYENGLAPYLARDIPAEQAWQRSVVPVREFLFRYTRQEELSLMTSMAKLEQPVSRCYIANTFFLYILFSFNFI